MQMKLEQKSRFFSAMGDPIRLKLITFMLERQACVCICQLAEHVKRDQSVVFRHVQILRDAGIVSTNKKDKFLMCCIKNKARIRKYMED
jgi:DNA-binding transcriptional ArsR family regulator